MKEVNLDELQLEHAEIKERIEQLEKRIKEVSARVTARLDDFSSETIATASADIERLKRKLAGKP